MGHVSEESVFSLGETLEVNYTFTHGHTDNLIAKVGVEAF